MNSVRIAFAATVMGAIVGGAAQAASDVEGTWKLQFAGKTCNLALSGDGSVVAGQDCPQIARWHKTGNDIWLNSGADEVVALLHPSDAGYAGKLISNNAQVALTR